MPTSSRAPDILSPCALNKSFLTQLLCEALAQAGFHPLPGLPSPPPPPPPPDLSFQCLGRAWGMRVRVEELVKAKVFHLYAQRLDGEDLVSEGAEVHKLAVVRTRENAGWGEEQWARWMSRSLWYHVFKDELALHAADQRNMHNLAVDLAIVLAEFLEVRDVVAVLATCKKTRAWGEEHALWERLCKRDGVLWPQQDQGSKYARTVYITNYLSAKRAQAAQLEREQRNGVYLRRMFIT